ncbi:MAG: dTDP-4-dehydrorhamnose reductase [Bacteroidales bacterium]|nr:dTDP-4-dehydrorhamnose reductase [Bacteroidales bacterium]
MNVLVTGSNGQLGTELRRLALDSPHHFIFTDINSLPGVETVYLDISDRASIDIIAESEKVDIIVNCAAYTDVERAESEIDMAMLLNHQAVENLAGAAASRDAALIHISTDYVFSGEGNLPIREDAVPAPKGVYGSTKLAGEKALQKSACRSVIVRTSWLYSPYGRNFVKTMRSLMRSGRELKVVYDQLGCPTYAADLADALMHIIHGPRIEGNTIYHYSDEGAVSWYDFAQAIRELSGYDCRVVPCLTGEYPTKARRPHYSVLDKSAIKRAYRLEIPYWRDSLARCIDRMDDGL